MSQDDSNIWPGKFDANLVLSNPQNGDFLPRNILTFCLSPVNDGFKITPAANEKHIIPTFVRKKFDFNVIRANPEIHSPRRSESKPFVIHTSKPNTRFRQNPRKDSDKRSQSFAVRFVLRKRLRVRAFLACSRVGIRDWQRGGLGNPASLHGRPGHNSLCAQCRATSAYSASLSSNVNFGSHE